MKDSEQYGSWSVQCLFDESMYSPANRKYDTDDSPDYNSEVSSMELSVNACISGSASVAHLQIFI